MADEEPHSVIINIPKPKTYYKDVPKQKTIQQKSVKPKISVRKASLPAITNIKPASVATFNKEEVFLPYLRYSKKQEKDRFKERMGVSIRQDYKIAYTDLRQRLYTEDPVDDTRAVSDFDPTFFMCARSSLITRYGAPYKSLKFLFNSQLMWRQEIGYRHDCMLNIDTNFKKEQDIYESSCKKYMQQVKYLDDFISADYKKSMLFLSRSEEMKIAVARKANELQYLAAKKFNITSKIVGLDYRYGLQQKYGRFLYYLSPPSWRMKNRKFARSIEIEAKGFDFGISSEEDTFNVIFENLKKECDGGLVKPVLYFQHPNDILEIFDGIEQQQLHHFTHVARLAPHTSFLKKGIKRFKDIIAVDSAGVLNLIKEFEKMLMFGEEQCSQLEAKFFKILNGSFYDNVGAPEVLNFQLHLEFCYEKVYNEKPMNLGVMGTAKALEFFYMDLTKHLESVTSNDITIAVKHCVESERRKFKKAKVASRELRLFERLERALLRAYAPMNPKHNPIHGSAKRSLPKKVLVRSNSYNHRKRLTEAEIEYLTLFTDWTENEDPSNFIRITDDNEYRNKSITNEQI